MRVSSKQYGKIAGIYVATCVVGMGLFYGLVLRPQNREFADLHLELTQLTEQFDQAQQAQSEQVRNRLQEQLSSLQKNWQDFVVDSGRASALALQISQLVNDLQVSDFSVHRKETQTREEMEDYKKIEESWLQIGFQGPFESFAQFLNRVERNQPAMFVEEFSLKRNLDPSAKPEAEVSLCYFVERTETLDAKKENGSKKATPSKPVAQIP